MTAIALHYVDLGPRDATPVLFLHAFPLSHAMWRPQLEALSPKYRVIACDFRGFGASAVGDGQHTLEHFVDDVVALLARLGIPRAVVCGLSMGGYVALRLAEREPHWVRALVLADTRAEADSNEAKVKRAAAMDAIASDGIAAFAKAFVKTAFTASNVAKSGGVVDDARALIETASPTALRGAILALASRTDTTASLARVGVPTLVMVGEEDALTPPAVARTMRDAIRGAEYFEVPRAAHMSSLEAPEAFTARLEEFLAKVG